MRNTKGRNVEQGISDMKKPISINGLLKALGTGVLLVGVGGCLGPNPLFFVGTSAANATIMRLVNMLFDSLVAGG